MHYQLENRLSSLMEAHQVDEKTLAAELGVNRAHVHRLKDDQWRQISRSDLQALMCWGEKLKKRVFAVEASPLWRTFDDADVALFRGRDDSGNPISSDSQVEGMLIEALGKERCRVEVINGDQMDPDQVGKAMRTKNAIFIGSPKHNLATENALAALWCLTPGNDSPENAKKAPFQFLWDSDLRRASAFGARKRGTEKIGVRMSVAGAKNSRGHHVPVDWLAPEHYARWNGKGRDAGVLVICHKPLGTECNVSSVILAGYSGFATQDMATDFIDDGLRIESGDVQPGHPVIRVLAARYKKVGTRHEKRQRVSKGRRWFGPPWGQLSVAFED